MDESTNGIILRIRPLTETSLIVHWLTEDLGRVATVAKGARRPKSKLHGKLDLFFEADFTFARSRRSDLHNLRELQLKNVNSELRKSLHKIEQLSYFTKMIEQTTEVDTPIPETHRLFRSVLNHLVTHPPQPRLVFAFELKHLYDLGLAPDPADSKLSPAGAELASQLIAEDWAGIAKLSTTAATARELQQFLHGLLIYHLDRLPKRRSMALKT